MINKISINKILQILCQQTSLIFSKISTILHKINLLTKMHSLVATLITLLANLKVRLINQLKLWIKWVTQKLFFLAIHATTITIPLSKLKNKHFLIKLKEKLLTLILKAKKMLSLIKKQENTDT